MILNFFKITKILILSLALLSKFYQIMDHLFLKKIFYIMYYHEKKFKNENIVWIQVFTNNMSSMPLIYINELIANQLPIYYYYFFF